MSVKQSVLKYLQLAKQLPDFLINSRRTLNKNKFLLDNLISRTPNSITPFLNNQMRIYGTADKELRELSDKHTIATGILEKYPEFRDRFISADTNLEMVNIPVILSITLISGSVITLYESVAFKINQQNKYLMLTETALNKYTSGQMTLTEFNNYIAGLKDIQVKPAVSFGQVVLIGSLIFAGYYALTNTDEVKKLIKGVF